MWMQVDPEFTWRQHGNLRKISARFSAMSVEGVEASPGRKLNRLQRMSRSRRENVWGLVWLECMDGMGPGMVNEC